MRNVPLQKGQLSGKGWDFYRQCLQYLRMFLVDAQGKATVTSQSSTSRLKSGSHRRLNTISRIRASTSMLWRVLQNTVRRPSKPRAFHSSVSVQTSPKSRTASKLKVGSTPGTAATAGVWPVTRCKAEMTDLSSVFS